MHFLQKLFATAIIIVQISSGTMSSEVSEQVQETVKLFLPTKRIEK